MAAERLSMRQIREILRQKWALGLPHRAVAQSVRLGLGTISSVLTRAAGAGLDWPQVQTLTDDVLESRLYGRPEVAGQRQRPAPDCAWIHAERRRARVTVEMAAITSAIRHGVEPTFAAEPMRRTARQIRSSSERHSGRGVT